MEEFDKSRAAEGLSYIKGFKIYSWECSKNETLKAVLHTHGLTEEERVYFVDRYGDVVYRTYPQSRPIQTSYKYLSSVLSSLRYTIPVYWDEQIMWKGSPRDDTLHT